MLTILLDTDIVEQVLSQEDKELQALVSLMAGPEEQSSTRAESHTEYGSDDDDYDSIFIEAVHAFDAQAQDDTPNHHTGQDQEMDMSHG